MNNRPGTVQGLPFLEEMLFEAFFWNPEQARPAMQEFLQQPEFGKLLSDWGRPGDKSLIAEENRTPIGVAWYRFWTAENHTYGFVDSETPELGLAVVANHRSKGIGRTLLRALVQVARDDGIRALSLSVDPTNFARQLYLDNVRLNL